jgi:hypothetical protein
VTDKPRRPRHEGQSPEVDIDPSVARPARVHSYLVGGDGHFAADREAVDRMAEVLPEGVDTARRSVDTMAAFQARAVRYLVGEGVTQFLKLGTAVPAGEDIHEIASDAAGGSGDSGGSGGSGDDIRVVYVGSDPVVLAHAHALRRASPEGKTAYVHGTLRDPEDILRQASATLDMALPVAMLLPATLNFVPDESDAYGIVARLVSAVSSGSYLVIAHVTYDPARERTSEAAERFSKLLGEPYVVRSAAEIARFFHGLDIVGPGVGAVERWQPPGTTPAEAAAAAGSATAASRKPVPLYGAVARKP